MGWRRVVFLSAVFVLAVSYLWPNETFHSELVEGKRVIVTGASSGIGKQLAYRYAELGASVFITARREALLEKVIKKCRDIGSPQAKFGFLSADMGDMSQTHHVIDAAVAEMGGIDQIILNHAYIPNFDLWSESPKNFETLKKVLDINTRSYAQLAAQAVPYLTENGGSIGVVSSIVGKIPLPMLVPYTASKFALDGFFSAYRHEIKSSNVSVSLVILGAIATEGFSKVVMDGEKRYKKAFTYEDLKNSLNPPASPEDCAYEIMRGTTMREEEVFFPSFIKYIARSRYIFSGVVNYMASEMLAIVDQ